ncbi:DUF397 domain-containing protein [Streptomyces niger]|uniref:DUF397 domain-containing protein n=1 Tax=Streptomyces niger TaxID=66373 RepID=UPI000699E318|nr:DUF397 domain-containing protein [Streptomyces niger]
MSTTELAWYKSSHSSAQGDNCVEVAVTPRAVHVRDSKDTTRPAMRVERGGWAAFVRHVARG